LQGSKTIFVANDAVENKLWMRQMYQYRRLHDSSNYPIANNTQKTSIVTKFFDKKEAGLVLFFLSPFNIDN